MALTIIVRGKHNTGKSTVANLIQMFLTENNFSDVKVADISPLPADQKDRVWNRFQRNQNAPVRIRVELEDGLRTLSDFASLTDTERGWITGALRLRAGNNDGRDPTTAAWRALADRIEASR